MPDTDAPVEPGERSLTEREVRTLQYAEQASARVIDSFATLVNEAAESHDADRLAVLQPMMTVAIGDHCRLLGWLKQLGWSPPSEVTDAG